MFLSNSFIVTIWSIFSLPLLRHWALESQELKEKALWLLMLTDIWPYLGRKTMLKSNPHFSKRAKTRIHWSSNINKKTISPARREMIKPKSVWPITFQKYDVLRKYKTNTHKLKHLFFSDSQHKQTVTWHLDFFQVAPGHLLRPPITSTACW